MTIKIYHPEGAEPYTENVALWNAATHVTARDQHATEAKALLDYDAGRWDFFAAVDEGSEDGEDWTEYAYDNKRAKMSIRSSEWECVSTYGATFSVENGESACDVEVCIAQKNGWWYIKTQDDCGGGDDCDATGYCSRKDAVDAASDYAEQHDECEGKGAKKWIAAQGATSAE